jgi:hypothetical protein
MPDVNEPVQLLLLLDAWWGWQTSAMHAATKQ